MFIANVDYRLLSSVGTLCLDKRDWQHISPLRGSRDGMSHIYKHSVPTGLKKVIYTFFYKHIVPTGLKIGQRKRRTVKTSYLCETVFNSWLSGTTRFIRVASMD